MASKQNTIEFFNGPATAHSDDHRRNYEQQMIGEMGVLLPSLEVGDEGWEEDLVDGMR